MYSLNIQGQAFQPFDPATVFESTVQIGRDIVNSRPVTALVAVTKRGLQVNALFLIFYSATTAIAITLAVASGAFLPILAAAMATTILTCAVTKTGLDASKIHVNDRLQEQNAALSILVNTIAEREEIINSDHLKLSQYRQHLTNFKDNIEKHTANKKLANFEKQFNRVYYVASTIKSVVDGSILWFVINIGIASYTEYAKDSLAKETKMEDLVNNINELRELTGVNSRDINEILKIAAQIQQESELLKQIKSNNINILPEKFTEEFQKREQEIVEKHTKHTSPAKAIIKSLTGASIKTDLKKIDDNRKKLLKEHKDKFTERVQVSAEEKNYNNKI